MIARNELLMLALSNDQPPNDLLQWFSELKLKFTHPLITFKMWSLLGLKLLRGITTNTLDSKKQNNNKTQPTTNYSKNYNTNYKFKPNQNYRTTSKIKPGLISSNSTKPNKLQNNLTHASNTDRNDTEEQLKGRWC